MSNRKAPVQKNVSVSKKPSVGVLELDATVSFRVKGVFPDEGVVLAAALFLISKVIKLLFLRRCR
jgi:hypothetical protein